MPSLPNAGVANGSFLCLPGFSAHTCSFHYFLLPLLNLHQGKALSSFQGS